MDRTHEEGYAQKDMAVLNRNFPRNQAPGGAKVIESAVGLAIPLSLRLFTDIYMPIPLLAALIAIVVSCSVGIGFGVLPAKLAAKLDPIESLRYE